MFNFGKKISTNIKKLLLKNDDTKTKKIIMLMHNLYTMKTKKMITTIISQLYE